MSFPFWQIQNRTLDTTLCQLPDLPVPDAICMPTRVFTSKGRIVILGRIVSASGQILRSDFRPQDEIFRPGMPFRPLDEQAL